MTVSAIVDPLNCASQGLQQEETGLGSGGIADRYMIAADHANNAPQQGDRREARNAGLTVGIGRWRVTSDGVTYAPLPTRSDTLDQSAIVTASITGDCARHEIAISMRSWRIMPLS